MKILVTGGAGFIGSHIVDAYIRDGHEVFVIDNLSTGLEQNINPDAHFNHCDICSSEACAVIEREKPDILNHHAAQIDVRRSIADPKSDIDTNVRGFINVMEACLRSRVKKVVFASSAAVYGEQAEFPATEHCPQRPLSPYGVNKLTVEQYLHYYGVVHGIKWVALRYANIYGPRQSHRGEAGVVALFIVQLLRGVQPMIHGDGNQTRDFACVSDVVRANCMALSEDLSGIYNVGTGIETSINVLFDMIQRLADVDVSRKYILNERYDLKRSCLSPALIAAAGWKACVNVNEGLQVVIDWIKKNAS